MRVLSYTSLYPDDARPHHGVFVEQRLRHLRAYAAKTGEALEVRVVAPVPWVPRGVPLPARYAPIARVRREEVRHGVPVVRPAYPVIPKVGMSVAPWLMAAGTRGAVERLRAEGYDFDLIDAHYAYPDGVAAALLARRLGRPLVITARGSDLNVIADYALPRRWLRWACGVADHLVTVCEDLRGRLIRLGVDPGKVTTLRNGVDLEAFRPGDRDAVRAGLGLAGPVLLSVGNLIPLKGHHRVIEALPFVPGATLLIVGEGPMRRTLEATARRLGVADRVRLVGRVPHEAMKDWFQTADLLVLASSSEGWANVLLEAMACGTPVAATDVGGSAEVVRAPEAGRLVKERTPAAIAAAVNDLLAAPPDRAGTRAYAEGFGWDETSAGVLRVFKGVLPAASGGVLRGAPGAVPSGRAVRP